ncbi:MAG: hypothetical protein ABL994_05270, partial [Verrucomicrobiales bacterium]
MNRLFRTTLVLLLALAARDLMAQDAAAPASQTLPPSVVSGESNNRPSPPPRRVAPPAPAPVPQAPEPPLVIDDIDPRTVSL